MARIEISQGLLEKTIQKRHALTNYRELLDRGQTQYASAAEELEKELTKTLEDGGGIEEFNKKASIDDPLKKIKPLSEWP